MNTLKNVNTIIFDFDYTLGNREIAAYRLFENLLTKVSGYDPDDIRLASMIQDCMIWDEYGTSDKLLTHKKLCDKYKVDTGIDNFSLFWNQHLFLYTELYEETISVLKKLKANGYKLGIITNGDSYGQRMKLKNAGIKEYFDDMVIGGDYEKQKPDKSIFELAVKNLNADKSKTIYVGDIFSNDVIGSSEAGLIPIWIWRHGNRLVNDKYIQINDLNELLVLLNVE